MTAIAAQEDREQAPELKAHIHKLNAKGPREEPKDWFAKFVGGRWVTHPTLFEQSPEFSETWPRSGSMRSGRAFERPMSAPLIVESGSSFWPTTGAHDAGSPRSANAEAADGHYKPHDLQRAAMQWPTPTSTDQKASGAQGYLTESGRHAGVTLTDAAVRNPMWPTPDAAVMNDGESWESWESRRAKLAEKGINGNGAGIPLAVAASGWATPTARDWKGQDIPGRSGSPSLPDQVMRLHGDESSPSDPTSRRHWNTPRAEMDIGGLRGTKDTLHSQVKLLLPKRRLNPRFVAWLMGLPPTWAEICGCRAAAIAPTSSASSATESCRLKPNAPSESCGSESMGSPAVPA